MSYMPGTAIARRGSRLRLSIEDADLEYPLTFHAVTDSVMLSFAEEAWG